ncbi:hypothetical protein [Pseudoalteromonas piscicida]|uniref:hypothetical protein n=1 Tax=Pseudoalteromonas piscicida TaxID=43662 RepID=UPI000E359A4F|nr:hypothetical protein [Pseudoalteromonas piscicida]AXQ98034.1 hypothetical protein D0N37_09880 [Pseudoalteromonas piscicida]
MKAHKIAFTTSAIILGATSTFVILMLSGFIFPYGSVEFGNWAMWFGAIFSGVASVGAIAAAIFTRSTIKFLTQQHDKQQELQKVHQYQSHKAEFYQLLDDIEGLVNNKIKFTSKLPLYRSIFPDNSFSNTDLQANKENSSLLDVVKLWNELCVNLHTQTNNSTFDAEEFNNKFSQKIDELQIKLHMKRVDKSTFGDVYFYNVGIAEPRKLFNTIDAYFDLHKTREILSHLLHFAGLDHIILKREIDGPFTNAFVMYHIRNQNQSYVINKEQDYLKIYEACGKYLCFLNNREHSNINLIHQCMTYTMTLHNVLDLLSNEKTQQQLRVLLLDDCQKFVSKPELSQYHKAAYDIIKQLS